jgi:hypothetical protein
MTRIVTIAREHGSGGLEIARRVAAGLGWALVDRVLIDEVARLARIPREDAERFDETVNPWLFRLVKSLWAGSPEVFASAPQVDIFDADTMARFTRSAVLAVAEVGDCVIVGRGAQCILQDRADALHVFVYAPHREKLERIRRMYRDEAEALRAMEQVDRMRSEYVHFYYGCHWAQRELYGLLINSSVGEEQAAQAILCAVRKGATG